MNRCGSGMTKLNTGLRHHTVRVAQVLEIIEASDHVVDSRRVVLASTAESLEVGGETVWQCGRFLCENNQS